VLGAAGRDALGTMRTLGDGEGRAGGKVEPALGRAREDPERHDVDGDDENANVATTMKAPATASIWVKG
jgi:hypothetical protein